MVASKYISLLAGLVAGVSAQAAFNAPENSAVILEALKTADDATQASTAAARAYTPGNAAQTREITFQNYVLRGAYDNITYLAQSSQGFYSDNGAQAIIDFINNKLYPDTKAGDQVYVAKRDVFTQGGFISFINPGLIALRLSVANSLAAIVSKTRSNRITAMTVAILSVELNYANTQEYQQFGKFQQPTCFIPPGLCGSQGGLGEVDLLSGYTLPFKLPFKA